MRPTDKCRQRTSRSNPVNRARGKGVISPGAAPVSAVTCCSGGERLHRDHARPTPLVSDFDLAKKGLRLAVQSCGNNSRGSNNARSGDVDLDGGVLTPRIAQAAQADSCEI